MGHCIGNLHVVNYGSSSVTVFTPEGMTYGSDVIQYPSGIAINPEGYVFISEYNNDRFFVFDPKHKQVNCVQEFYNPGDISLECASTE